MIKKQTIANIALVVAALFWGSTFVAQSEASRTVEPFTFLASRSLLGFLFLIPVSIIKDAMSKKAGTYIAPTKKSNKSLIIGGVCCGAMLTIASGLQQFGITPENSGKAGFITAMYLLLVPIFGLFFKKKVSPVIWCCVALGVVGLYFLCIPRGSELLPSGFKLETTDIYLMICAVAFTCHILIVDRFSPYVDGVKLSCLQFFVTFVLATILALIFDNTSFTAIFEAWLPIAYAGILSSGIAYTLQIIGQKYSESSTVASLLMSLESVFAVLTAMVIQNKFPTPWEYIGSGIIFAAIIISQLPIGAKKEE